MQPWQCQWPLQPPEWGQLPPHYGHEQQDQAGLEPDAADLLQALLAGGLPEQDQGLLPPYPGHEQQDWGQLPPHCGHEQLGASLSWAEAVSALQSMHQAMTYDAMMRQAQAPVPSVHDHRPQSRATVAASAEGQAMEAAERALALLELEEEQRSAELTAPAGLTAP
ncbi:unnamed protein product [Prorocentrum cordatum]|uniref:Uncharacterized protein n=1 Tax=Prorocentrum cordatum TaxID=2364126 RepID=A0ABN9VYI8_9DINO|nr:unnamed protein product [Polarella glacialis]